jgi:hypothetical protein
MDDPSAPEPVIPVKPDASEEPSSRGSGGFFVWVFLLVLLILYPLSVGPVVRLAFRIPKLETAVQIVYAPIGFICEHCIPVDKFFDWYLFDLWRVRRRGIPATPIAPPTPPQTNLVDRRG